MNDTNHDPADPRAQPELFEALIPVSVLIAMLAASVAVFGADSSYGPNQIALLLAAGTAAIIGSRRGFHWDELQQGMINAIVVALPAMLILLFVGALIGAWILAGTVPYLIILGATLLSPEWFYPACCLICGLVSLSIGSSWTTAGTLGVALIGAATAMDLDLAMTAGAIISGAYFGDKMSPLSDTTNLAAAVSRTDLFTHIRHMVWTSAPALLLALALFALLGRVDAATSDPAVFDALAVALGEEFRLGPLSLLPLVVLIVLSARKFPPLPTIGIGALAGVLCALVLQYDAAVALSPSEGLGGLAAALGGAWYALFSGYSTTSELPAMSDLLDRGGMSSMLNTVWLIMCAMVFGGVMERTGLLQRLVADILRLARGAASLIITTMGTGFVTNVLAADQYIAVVIPGRLYEHAYREQGLAPENLSRALEDGGTLTSVLIPWNTCGAFMAATLGVPTWTYLPWCLFNFAAFGFSALWAITGVSIRRDTELAPRTA